MNEQYEFEYVYPVENWTQPELPPYSRLPSDHVKKRKGRGGLYIPDGVVGHIVMRVGTRNKKGEMEWTEGAVMCGTEVDGLTVTRKQVAQGRTTCPECVEIYKANHNLPEVRKLANWEQGGTKVFNGA